MGIVVRKTLLAAAAAGLVSGPAPATEPLVPLAPAIRVSSPLDSRSNTNPVVASDPDGDFVVVWQFLYIAGDNDVYAQRFFADGRPNGTTIVPFATTQNEVTPVVAMDAAGNFVVAAERAGDIVGKLYSAAGAELKSFVVNPTTTGSQVAPAVAMHSSGVFAVAWHDSTEGISHFRPYSADGTPGSVASAGLLATQPAIAWQADGNQLVFLGVRTDNTGIIASLCTSPACNGSRGIQLTTDLNISRPSAVADASGGFEFAWLQGGTAIHARYLSPTFALGPDLTLLSSGTIPRVVLNPDQSFAIAWQPVNLQRFDNSGLPLSSPTDLRSSRIPGLHGDPSIAIDADGDLLIAWSQSEPPASPVVWVRRVRGPEDVDVEVVQSPGPQSAPTGSPLTYDLIASNLHPTAPQGPYPAVDAAIGSATNVRVIDVLPDGATGATAGGTNWSCVIASGKANCLYGGVLPADGETPPVRVTFFPPDRPGESIANIAKARADQLDSRTANNRAVERTTLTCPPSVIELGAASYTVAEGAANLTVAAKRTGGSCGTVTARYDTGGSSAKPGSDFTDVTGVLTWADGDTANKTFKVPMVDDALDETDEKFVVTLGNVNGGVLGSRDTARATISDDDPSPRVNFTARSQSAGEAAGLRSVTLQLSEISGRDVTVPLNVSGTATRGGDYFLGATTLTIPAGQSQASLQVEIADDAVVDPGETLVLTIGTPNGATAGSIATHTLTITDND